MRIIFIPSLNIYFSLIVDDLQARQKANKSIDTSSVSQDEVARVIKKLKRYSQESPHYSSSSEDEAPSLKIVNKVGKLVVPKRIVVYSNN